MVWVARDTSHAANPKSYQKQRIINNQEEVTTYLRDKCNKLGIDFIVADFYGDKKDTPFQEQALFVSKASIMIGMHGAGLNMFHFMPFNSVVVEINKKYRETNELK
jgi:capsular polysaccharide biosynthesis protein